MLKALRASVVKILALAMIAAGLAYLWVNTQTPLYQSETQVLVESQETTFTRPSGETQASDSSSMMSEEAVASQIQIITSRDLARKVVKRYELGKLAEFDPLLEGMSALKGVLVTLGIARDPMQMSAEERVLTKYYERLTVYRATTSRVIVIEFSAADPKLAADVANAVAEEYLAWQQSAKAENTRGATVWLENQIADLRKRVAEAEGKVAAFRSGSDLLVGQNNMTLGSSQLADINAQLARVRAEKSEAEAKAKQLGEMLASGRDVENINEIMSSPLIQRLQEQVVTQKAAIAQQSITLLPGHPRIRELNAQLTDLEAQIRREANRIVRGYANDATLAAAREQSLTEELATLKAEASRAGEQEVDLRALEREAKAQRDLLESFLARYREAAARQDAADLPADARIISRASPSNEPAYPKKLVTIVAATVAVLILSVLFVLVRELLAGSGLKRRDDLDGIAVPVVPGEVPVDGVVLAEPQLPPPLADEPMAAATPRSPIRNVADLDARIAGADTLNHSRIVVVAGAGPAAGGAETAIGLARNMSAGGASIVLIDVAARGGELSRLMAARAMPGLVDLLDGEVSFAQVLFRDRASRVHFIGVGEGRDLSLEDVDSDRFHDVLEALAQTYDRVVIDVGEIDAGGVASYVAGLAGFSVLAARGTASDPATLRAYIELKTASRGEVSVIRTEDAAAVRSRRTPASRRAA
mgnify:CR=1 FL=1